MDLQWTVSFIWAIQILAFAVGRTGAQPVFNAQLASNAACAVLASPTVLTIGHVPEPATPTLSRVVEAFVSFVNDDATLLPGVVLRYQAFLSDFSQASNTSDLSLRESCSLGVRADLTVLLVGLWDSNPQRAGLRWGCHALPQVYYAAGPPSLDAASDAAAILSDEPVAFSGRPVRWTGVFSHVRRFAWQRVGAVVGRRDEQALLFEAARSSSEAAGVEIVDAVVLTFAAEAVLREDSLIQDDLQAMLRETRIVIAFVDPDEVLLLLYMAWEAWLQRGSDTFYQWVFVTPLYDTLLHMRLAQSQLLQRQQQPGFSGFTHFEECLLGGQLQRMMHGAKFVAAELLPDSLPPAQNPALAAQVLAAAGIGLDDPEAFHATSAVTGLLATVAGLQAVLTSPYGCLLNGGNVSQPDVQHAFAKLVADNIANADIDIHRLSAPLVRRDTPPYLLATARNSLVSVRGSLTSVAATAEANVVLQQTALNGSACSTAPIPGVSSCGLPVGPASSLIALQASCPLNGPSNDSCTVVLWPDGTSTPPRNVILDDEARQDLSAGASERRAVLIPLISGTTMVILLVILSLVPASQTTTTYDDWLMFIQHGAEQQQNRSKRKVAASLIRQGREMFGNLTIDAFIGAGSFGKVYKGTWNGELVAIKIIQVQDSEMLQSAAHEALLSKRLIHRNIVRTLQFSIREFSGDARRSSGRQKGHKLDTTKVCSSPRVSGMRHSASTRYNTSASASPHATADLSSNPPSTDVIERDSGGALRDDASLKTSSGKAGAAASAALHQGFYETPFPHAWAPAESADGDATTNMLPPPPHVVGAFLDASLSLAPMDDSRARPLQLPTLNEDTTEPGTETSPSPHSALSDSDARRKAANEPESTSGSSPAGGTGTKGRIGWWWNARAASGGSSATSPSSRRSPSSQTINATPKRQSSRSHSSSDVEAFPESSRGPRARSWAWLVANRSLRASQTDPGRREPDEALGESGRDTGGDTSWSASSQQQDLDDEEAAATVPLTRAPPAAPAAGASRPPSAGVAAPAGVALLRMSSGGHPTFVRFASSQQFSSGSNSPRQEQSFNVYTSLQAAVPAEPSVPSALESAANALSVAMNEASASSSSAEAPPETLQEPTVAGGLVWAELQGLRQPDSREGGSPGFRFRPPDSEGGGGSPVRLGRAPGGGGGGDSGGDERLTLMDLVSELEGSKEHPLTKQHTADFSDAEIELQPRDDALAMINSDAAASQAKAAARQPRSRPSRGNAAAHEPTPLVAIAKTLPTSRSSSVHGRRSGSTAPRAGPSRPPPTRTSPQTLSRRSSAASLISEPTSGEEIFLRALEAVSGSNSTAYVKREPPGASGSGHGGGAGPAPAETRPTNRVMWSWVDSPCPSARSESARTSMSEPVSPRLPPGAPAAARDAAARPRAPADPRHRAVNVPTIPEERSQHPRRPQQQPRQWFPSWWSGSGSMSPGSNVSPSRTPNNGHTSQSKRKNILAALGSSLSPVVSGAKQALGAASSSGAENAKTSNKLMKLNNTIAQKLRMECWIILEYCDGGSLDAALAKGLFHPHGTPNMLHIMNLCLQIAQGMSYLHSQNVYHGDLKAVNVLLTVGVLDSRAIRDKLVNMRGFRPQPDGAGDNNTPYPPYSHTPNTAPTSSTAGQSSLTPAGTPAADPFGAVASAPWRSPQRSSSTNALAAESPSQAGTQKRTLSDGAASAPGDDGSARSGSVGALDVSNHTQKSLETQPSGTPGDKGLQPLLDPSLAPRATSNRPMLESQPSSNTDMATFQGIPRSHLIEDRTDTSVPFTAKIADFGVSRVITGTHVQTQSLGTLTHMPPEVLLSGKQSYKMDTYSFGMLMWEIYCAEEPYKDMMIGEIVAGVLHEMRPAFPPHCPPVYQALAQRCWRQDPDARPSIAEVVTELQNLQSQVKDMQTYCNLIINQREVQGPPDDMYPAD